jgi:hypothetical protein
MSVPEAGQLAPDVVLPDDTGAVHRLADQRVGNQIGRASCRERV